MRPDPSPDMALARFASGLDPAAVPPRVRAHARASIANALACGFAGCREPAIAIWLDAMGRHRPAGGASLIGRPERVDPMLAAEVNAMAVNIHDFDETHLPTINHPAAPVAAALLALAQMRKITGAAFLRAFLIGSEASCRLGKAVSPWHYARGWHITSTCGAPAAALACGAALRLPEERLVWALGNAAVQACGMVEALGTMSKSLSVGAAARAGLAAALLAEAGFSGPVAPIGGERGFLRLYGEPPDADALAADLGAAWEIEAVAFKPYPVGVVLNPVIDAAFRLRGAGIAGPEALERVTLRGNPLLRQRADRPDAASGRLAQVSAQHAIAAVLLFGRAGLEAFSDAAAAATLGRRPRIEFVDDPACAVGRVSARALCRDGRELFVDVAAALGTPERPMSGAEIEDKLGAAMRAAGAVRGPEELLAAVAEIESLDDAAAIAELASGGRDPG